MKFGRVNITIFGFVLLMIALVLSCEKKDPSPATFDCSTINSSYSSGILPIINANCNTSGCHNAGSVNGDFTTYAGLKLKVDNGSINNRVIVQKNMPPSGALSVDNINKIKCWLNSGAPNN